MMGLRNNFLDVKRLNHSNIIKYKVLYINEIKRRGWLVMEYIKAMPLDKVNLTS